MQRRSFLTATALAAASYSRVLGANDRVNVGIIGTGNRGGKLWESFLAASDVNPSAACDVYEPHLERALSMAQGRAKGYRDFRELLDHKPLDAVVVATPDHWHAIPVIRACQAGLDVYVEKPLSLTVEEGRLMVQAARKYERVVQTGSQQRSGPHYAEAVELIQSGGLGAVHHVAAGMVRNSMPGFGDPPDGEAPANFNYDMWLGPAPKRPYNPLRGHYHFRWFWDYSGGQMTNWGAHNLDIARWALDLAAPRAVSAYGGRYAIADGGETPDVQEVLYQLPDGVATWGVRELNGRRGPFLEFHGTKATLSINRRGYEILGETWQREKRMAEDQEQPAPYKQGKLTDFHVRNFLDCVKSRARPNADVEEGHLTAAMCHLGNVATRLGRSLEWDAEAERFIGDKEADEWLSRPYREPWKLGPV